MLARLAHQAITDPLDQLVVFLVGVQDSPQAHVRMSKQIPDSSSVGH
jgi:hypothetical protein